MTSLLSEARNGLRVCVLGLAAATAALAITSDAADARHHRRLHVHYVYTHHERVHHHASSEDYSPPSASIIVDGNTGQVLQASNPDAPRHPASLTKIMTLYLLFERLDAGKIRLDTPLGVSAHAAGQDPTKLGLKPGSTIPVEDAIKGIVTRSANDAAVVIAENLGGSEDEFALMMTQKAHALGMGRTTYVNASGLPADEQITTARDQALLGRAIQEHFPRYYKYFSTPVFVYHGEAIRNHDHLLGSVAGVDGIKTGFTRASGFNLVTSLHRDGRYLVGVVLGGRSGFQRDAHMRELLSEHFNEAALRRTAPVLAEQAPQHEQPQQRELAQQHEPAQHREPAQPAAPAKASIAARAEPARTAMADAHPGSTDPIQPLLVKTISYRIAPVQTASLSPMPALVAASASAPAAQPAPAPAAARTQVASAVAEAPRGDLQVARPAPTHVEVATAEYKLQAAASEPAAPQSHAHGGWLIQIGAFEGEDDARQHLTAAQVRLRSMLGTADPFTERVQKGDKALYRARFAGFDKITAEAACRELKRNEFECMALKD